MLSFVILISFVVYIRTNGDVIKANNVREMTPSKILQGRSRRKMRKGTSREKQVFLVDFYLTFPRFPPKSKNGLNTSLVPGIIYISPQKSYISLINLVYYNLKKPSESYKSNIPLK